MIPALVLVLATGVCQIAGPGCEICPSEYSNSEKATLTIDRLQGALALFRFDVGRYPSTQEGLAALLEDPKIRNWAGPYLSETRVPKDPWGREHRYESDGQSYLIESLGADGQRGGTGEDADISQR